jgi:pyrimidine-nucleoside phosphorylase
MRAVDIIAKKRDGQALNHEEILWFIDAYTDGDLPDYQAAAFLMAVCIRGMTTDEVTSLTLAMAESGDRLDLTDIAKYVVDKHSSGGVGDKTSLVVLPLVASCGISVAKMSGRGLGFSGGTLDKLEAIAGFQVNLSEADFRAQARRIGLALSGQSRDLAPADGKLYALRDVTATVPSLPLIASSIMSKKLAAGSHGIVLDVKVGCGAFMTNLDEARQLAETMVAIGANAGRDMVALISDMNQPLGCAVGNALEVVEALETLRGDGPEASRAHCLEVAAHMLRLAGQGKRWANLDETKAFLAAQLDGGAALSKFREMIEAQGGDVGMVDHPDRLPQAAIVETFSAEQSGYLERVAADQIAWAAFELGAGREKKGDPIDLAVGVRVCGKVGDAVQQGDTLATIYANDQPRLEASRKRLQAAFVLRDEPVGPLPLFYDIYEELSHKG